MELKKQINSFAKDVQSGLSLSRKKIPAKYLYDERGSELFNEITRHPDYYLTQSEIEILNNNKAELSQLLQDETFNLIELGPGEGIKTLILLEQFLKDSRSFSYCMIDISRQYIDYLSDKFLTLLPELKIMTVDKEFREGLHQLKLDSDRKNVVLFFGSSIGNFNPEEANPFLNAIHQDLNAGDYLLIGFDLRKNPSILNQAYNDSKGLTAAFNLNLLNRMNRELQANFQMDQFMHYETYNVYSYAMESYLVSLKSQEVCIGSLEQCFCFDEFEPLLIEFSYKYNHAQIEQLAKHAGFNRLKNFEDSKKYFVLSLWQA